MLKLYSILSIFITISFFPFFIDDLLARTLTFQENNTLKPDFLLQKGQSFEKSLEGNQKHTYKIEIGSEQLIDLVVEQQGIDVVATLIDESGKSVFEIDSPNGNNGPEPVYFVTEKNGIYTLEVKSLDEKASLGKYKIIFNNLRDARNEDKEEILARKLYLEGRILRGEGTIKALKASIEKYLSALIIWKKLNNLVAQEECLSFIGLAYHEVNDEISAIKYYQEALEITKQTKNVYQEAILLGNIGASNQALGKYEEALPFFSECLALLDKIKKGDDVQKAITFYNLSNTLLILGKTTEAFEFAKKACDMAVKNDYLFEQPRYFLGVASIYKILGKLEEAIDNANKSLLAAKRISSLALLCEGYIVTGEIYLHFGDRQKAMNYFHKALSLNKILGDKVLEANTNAKIGLVYAYFEDFDKAIEFYEKSLSFYVVSNNKVRQSEIFNNLAIVYKRQNKYEKALESFKKSLSIQKELKVFSEEIIITNNLSSLLVSLKRYEEAEQILTEILEKNKLVGNAIEESNIKYNLGTMHFYKGDYKNAERFLQDSLNTLDVVLKDYHIAKIRTLLVLSKLTYIQKRYKETNKFITEMLNMADNIFKTLSRDEFRIAFLSTIESIYEFAIDFYVDQGNNKMAVELNETNKIRGLTTLINEKKLQIEEKYTKETTEVQQKIASKSAILAQLLSNRTQDMIKNKEVAALKEELETLKDQLDLIKKSLSEQNPNYYNLVEGKESKVETIKALLDKDTVLLEYFLGNTKSYLWVLTADSIKTFVLPSKNEIEKLVEEYISLIQNMYKSDSLTNKHEVYIKLSRDLSKILVLPAINEIQEKRLLVVPDKILHFLPFASLVDENDLPLIVKHELVYLPSASFVVSLRQKETNQKEQTNKSILIVADPVFNESDSRISKKDSKDEKKIENQTDFELEMALRDFSNINRLPYTREEGYNIKKLFNSPHTEMLLDFDANLEKLKILNLQQFPFLHFSTHTLINEKNPELSGLLLSMVDENGNKKSGILTVNQILNLNLNADLVVLSACKTALGKPSGQEGLVGLTRSFFYAGSRKVMGSLWNVSDKGTNELMTRFYTYITKDKLKPIVALREAQKSMLKDKNWNNPFYWAAFQIYGDWR